MLDEFGRIVGLAPALPFENVPVTLPEQVPVEQVAPIEAPLPDYAQPLDLGDTSIQSDMFAVRPPESVQPVDLGSTSIQSGIMAPAAMAESWKEPFDLGDTALQSDLGLYTGNNTQLDPQYADVANAPPPEEPAPFQSFTPDEVDQAAALARSPEALAQAKIEGEQRRLEEETQLKAQTDTDNQEYLRRNNKIVEEALSQSKEDMLQIQKEREILAKTEVDPSRWWKNASGVSKVASFISIAAGGLLAPNYGGRNTALEAFEKRFTDDVESQKGVLDNMMKNLDMKAADNRELYKQQIERYKMAETERLAYYDAKDSRIAAEMVKFDPRGTAVRRLAEERQIIAKQRAAAEKEAEETLYKRRQEERKFELEAWKTKQEAASRWATYNLAKKKQEAELRAEEEAKKAGLPTKEQVELETKIEALKNAKGEKVIKDPYGNTLGEADSSKKAEAIVQTQDAVTRMLDALEVMERTGPKIGAAVNGNFLRSDETQKHIKTFESAQDAFVKAKAKMEDPIGTIPNNLPTDGKEVPQYNKWFGGENEGQQAALIKQQRDQAMAKINSTMKSSGILDYDIRKYYPDGKPPQATAIAARELATTYQEPEGPNTAYITQSLGMEPGGALNPAKIGVDILKTRVGNSGDKAAFAELQALAESGTPASEYAKQALAELSK
jgi:hypothetical protein